MILVDVDTQHDFMDPAGALYVPGAERLVDNLAAIVAAAHAHGVPHLATLDTHTPDDPEFAAYGFPAHCVAGTPGHAKLAVTAGARVFPKATFDVYTNPAFAEAVAGLAPETALVVGVATDYCVKAAALGLLGQGVAVLLISSELPELLHLATRMLVLRDGRLVGELSREDATQDAMMRLMAGVAA